VTDTPMPPRTNHADAAFDASLTRAHGADLVRRAAGWTTEIEEADHA
jgi:hypothetical protein